MLSLRATDGHHSQNLDSTLLYSLVSLAADHQRPDEKHMPPAHSAPRSQ